jgi:hypothetical protein
MARGSHPAASQTWRRVQRALDQYPRLTPRGRHAILNEKLRSAVKPTSFANGGRTRGSGRPPFFFRVGRYLTGGAEIMAARTNSRDSDITRTAGEIFPDGTAIELVRSPGSAEGLGLAHLRDGVCEYKHEIRHPNGRIYAPIDADPSLARAIRFPSRIGPPESAGKLFGDVHDLLRGHLAQLESCTTAMVFAIFASWMSPILPMAPILYIFAPAGSPRNLTLQLLQLLCRRPLCLAGVGRAAMLRLPMEVKPTLLLAEPDLQPVAKAILLSAAHRGSYLSGRDGIRDLFGPKIIVSSQSPQAMSVEADVVHVALAPISGEVHPLDRISEDEVAEEFQARFLGYFLRNFSRVEMPKFDVSGLEQPGQAVARTLGAAVIGDAELQARILPSLKIRDEEIRAGRARSCEAVLLEALLFFVHQNGWTKVHAGNIAEKMGAIYKGRGDDLAPSAESVGWALRRLGIPSGRINRAGNGVVLSSGTRRLIHGLARALGVRTLDGGLRDDCEFCSELQPRAPGRPVTEV